MYLIDTDILIDFFKAKYRLNNKFKAVGLKNCYVSEITIAEITYGALKSSDIKKELKNVSLVKSNFSVLPITDVLDLYSEERLRLERVGTRIPDFDLLIGVTSVVMVTGNEKHHSRIKGIVIENWRTKENNEFLT
ncbi:MAG: PIN domain-containing protein [Bacteroidota bacterium]